MRFGQRAELGTALQRKLFQEIKKRYTNCSWNKLAKRIGSTGSALKKYRNGQLTIPQPVFEKLLQLIPQHQRIYFKSKTKFKDGNWGAVKGGKIGIKKLAQKYGKKKLAEWRKIGRQNSVICGQNLKQINIPKLNTQLAEFIGAYLGDGTLTKYFLRIFVDKRYCLSYLNYLKEITQEAFGIQTKVVLTKRNVAYLEIKSKKVCEYLNREFGFKFGDKKRNKTVIPNLILQKPILVLSCLRGLIDTDGSISKRGNQLCLAFTAHNPSLLKQVYKIGQKMELFTYSGKTQIGTNSWPKIVKYFQTIGSSNITHIIRFLEYYWNRKLLYRENTRTYFKKYNDIKFPYYGPMV